MLSIDRFRSRKAALIEEKDAKAAQGIDVTLPGRPLPSGALHPLTQVLEAAVRILRRMGFALATGPEIETEDVVEGGENRFVHRLPKAVKHPKLVLKRGIAPVDSPLVKWCKSVLEGGLSAAIETKELHVRLLNENKDPLRAWSFVNAYPIKWEIESFNSTKNEVAIEMIELSYDYSTREN